MVFALLPLITHYVRSCVFRRDAQAYVDVIQHQVPFHYRTFIMLRQLPEHFPKINGTTPQTISSCAVSV